MRRVIETDKIVGVSEIASFAGVTPNSVTNWRARHTDFPAPLAELRSGPVFYLPEVEAWMTATGRTGTD